VFLVTSNGEINKFSGNGVKNLLR